jgi:beta-glucosidase
MGAIANRYGHNEAPVMAVEAGADILLMPVDPEGAIQAVCDAVASGRISRERIQASVKRIWNAKTKVSPNLGKAREQELNRWGQTANSAASTQTSLRQLAQPSALSTAAKILQDSMQTGGSFPVLPEPDSSTRKLRNLIVVDDALACEFLGRHTPAVTLPRQLGYELQIVDRHTPPTQQDVAHPVASHPTLLQVFIRGNPFRGSAGLTPVAEEWFKKLLRNADLQALVIYGSPYVLKQFLPDLPPGTPYVFSYGQMPEAQAIALEVLFSQSIPVNALTLFL